MGIIRRNTKKADRKKKKKEERNRKEQESAEAFQRTKNVEKIIIMINKTHPSQHKNL